MRLDDLARAGIAVSFATLLGIAWLVYQPGLGGAFLFDDFANLPSLGAFGTVDNATAFWRYITSGSADPTGRPLALLSFLIDANNWPADPYPFKRTGLLLHLVNGALLAGLLFKLGRALGKSDTRASLAALVGCGLWLLHPLFVSTTLYVVQREAMLPTTFVLLGLLGWCRERNAAVSGNVAWIYIWAAAVVICTVLALLSKANGALLPLFVWIMDSIVLTRTGPIHSRSKPHFAVVRVSVVLLPSALVFLYLAKVAYHGFVAGLPAIRPWTLGERLLTEARVLVDYIDLLLIPRPFTAGLFNDTVTVSTGLFSPPGTILCLLLIGALLTLAWKLRRKHPAISAAVLFFFAGHLIESTVVPLELYYEHRNYAPALFLFWPLALWLTADTSAVDASATNAITSRIRIPLAIALLCGMAAMTYMGAALWGNSAQQAFVWALKNPDSPRAQAYAAQVELARGQTAAAVSRLERALVVSPDELQLTLNLVGAKCSAQLLAPEDLERAARALQKAPNAGRLGYTWFERALALASGDSCFLLDLDALDRLLDAAAKNLKTEQIPGRKQDRLHLQGRIALLRGDTDRALSLFNAALEADPRPDPALEQSALLATAGRPELALRHLDVLNTVWHAPSGPGWSMPSLHAWLLCRDGYWESELSRMRGLLEEDIAAKSASGRASSQ